MPAACLSSCLAVNTHTHLHIGCLHSLHPAIHPWTISGSLFFMRTMCSNIPCWDGSWSLPCSLTKSRKKLYCMVLWNWERMWPITHCVTSALQIISFPLHEELQDAQMHFLKHNLKIMRQMRDTTCSWQRPLSGSVCSRFNLARCCSYNAWPPSILKLSSLCNLGTKIHRIRRALQKECGKAGISSSVWFYSYTAEEPMLQTYKG